MSEPVRNDRHLRLMRSTTRNPRDNAMSHLGDHLMVKQPQIPPPIDLTWTCPKCGVILPRCLPSGTRWVRRSCACEIAARKAQEEAQRKALWQVEQAHRTFGGWLGDPWTDDDVIAEMKSKTFASYEAARFPEAYRAARAFASDPVGNFLLFGNCGTGKSHLEAAILNATREEREMRSLLISTTLFFKIYESTQKSFDQTAHIKLIEQMISTPLLVIDDIDKIPPTEARQDAYFLILDERYKARRSTILSTNRQESLGDYIGEFALSRLSRRLVSVPMFGVDYRLEEE
jgi:DNA replication protein DnaC